MSRKVGNDWLGARLAAQLGFQGRRLSRPQEKDSSARQFQLCWHEFDLSVARFRSWMEQAKLVCDLK
jgi:hypothetical protein